MDPDFDSFGRRRDERTKWEEIDREEQRRAERGLPPRDYSGYDPARGPDGDYGHPEYEQ